jgi:hypothetical protein
MITEKIIAIKINTRGIFVVLNPVSRFHRKSQLYTSANYRLLAIIFF